MQAVVQELLARDTGKMKMPSLPEFYGGLNLPIIISRDATGKGNLQFTTLAARTPWASKSAQALHILGFGNCGDGRDGTTRLLGPNLEIINNMVEAAAEDRPTVVDPDAGKSVKLDPYFTDDVSALRHGEHLANSGWCGCTRDKALRQFPFKPATVPAMRALVNGDSGSARCRELSCLEREILSHTPPKGEDECQPCIAPGCTFAHDPKKRVEQLRQLLEEEARLAADTTKRGKAKYSAWRMLHAWKGTVPHFNVQPGMFGRPLFRHHFRKQILDALHLALLGLPKTPWKHGIKVNASDDARERMSDLLKSWNHPLDMRRKEDGRVREQKWFTGEKWISFCAGKGGSPGGPIAIAMLVMIIADDLIMRGVDSGAGEAEPAQPPPAPGGRGRGQTARGGGAVGGRGRGGRGANFAAAMVAKSVPARSAVTAVPGGGEGALPAKRAQVEEKPSAVEAAANQESLAILRKIYGSRARTIINILLAFDAYFKWYYPFKASIPYESPMAVREARALDNCRLAIDMQEMFERVSIHKHGSFLPHGAVFKVTRDILEVADVWAHDLSALELQNAESKRVYETGGARHLQLSSEGTNHRTQADGTITVITTKGYGATAATSTLDKMLLTKELRSGDGPFAGIASRRNTRLFGETGTGRSRSVKLEFKNTGFIGPAYDPAKDSCLDAYVRVLLARIEAESYPTTACAPA